MTQFKLEIEGKSESQKIVDFELCWAEEREEEWKSEP